MVDLSAPTARADWRRMAGTVASVLRRPAWLGVAAVASLLVVSLFVAATESLYLRTVVLGGSLSPSRRLDALVGLYPLLGERPHLLRGSVLWLTAAAVGTNVAVALHAFRHGGLAVEQGAGSAAAIGVGTLGAGCAPCWLAVVASALSASGLAALLVALPLGGVEFLVLSLALIALSLHWIADGIHGADGEACSVE